MKLDGVIEVIALIIAFAFGAAELAAVPLIIAAMADGDRKVTGDGGERKEQDAG